LTTYTLQETPAFQRSRALLDRLGGPGILVVLLWPWLLLIINSGWIFLNGTYIDAWIYYGLFSNLPEYLKVYADIPSSYSAGVSHFYYDDRLTWILPGYAIHQLFSPLIANYILHFGLYYGVVLALYGTLVLTVHRRVALVTVLLLGSYSYFLGAIGWDYVDGPGLAYFSITLLLLTLAAKRSHRLFWLILAGAAAAALIFTNLFWIALTPAVGLYYLAIHWHRPIKSIILGLLPLTIGALILTSSVGFINVVLGGPFVFFASSLAFASSAINLQANPWVNTPSDWVIRNPFLVWPGILMLACTLVLTIPRLRKRYRQYPITLILMAQFLVLSGIMVAFHLGRSTPILQVVFYASYVIPALFLAIGAILTPLVTNIPTSRFIGLIAVTACAALLSFAFRACANIPIPYPVLPAIGLGLGWLLLTLCWPARLWPYGVFIIAFFAATPSALTDYNAGAFCKVAPAVQVEPEENYLAVQDGMEAVRQIVSDRRVYFWFDQNETPTYIGLSSTHFFSWNLISLNFPSISGLGAYPGGIPPNGITIALLSKDPQALARAQAALLERNRSIHLLGQKTIQRGALQFSIYVFDIRAIAMPVALNQKIDFSRMGYIERFLLGGWGTPEGFGIWTVGPRSTLGVNIKRPPRRSVDMTVDVANTVGAFVAQPPSMKIDVFVNGVHLDTWNFGATRQSGIFTVEIPDAVLAITDTTQIGFDIVDPHRPSAIGGDPNDTRQLGIAIRSIQFDTHNFWEAQSSRLGLPPPDGVRVGRAEQDGWAASTSADPEGFLQYGPYIATLPPGDHVATWALMIDNNIADNQEIVRLEVVDSASGEKILASRVLTRKQWTSANQYQTFSLPFTLDSASASYPLEFRVYWYDHSYVRERDVSVQ
jgi:hypothetical protein